MKDDIRCVEVEKHFNRLWAWDTKDYFTDGFKAGDKNTVIKKIGVMWKPKFKDIIKAYEDGCNFLVCHESIATFADNYSKQPDSFFAVNEEQAKFQYIRDNNIVIYRCHDLWDRINKIGVRDTWRDFLLPSSTIITSHYPYYVSAIEPTSLENLAKHVLRKVQSLGQNGVLVCGDKTRTVCQVATGTGVCSDTAAMKSLGADVGIVTDDYYYHVRQGVLSEEMDFPTITVNHNVAEEMAIENLYKHLNETYIDTKVHFYKQRCPYEIIY
jgi:putative NIF3 family GTP cyclohydrolase 1 type 2